MKYLVMECHPAFAVVMTEDGKLIKVANMHYEVGQTVTDIIELSVFSEPPKRRLNLRMASAFVAAACLILALIPVLIIGRSPFASVYMKINPEVRIDVDNKENVIGLTAVNDDGVVLIEGYEYKNKNLDTVLNELVDKAIQLKYLKEGGKVSVTLEADDDVWMQSKRETVNVELYEFLAQKMSVTVEVNERHRDDDADDDDDDDIDDDDDDDIDDDDDDIDDDNDDEDGDIDNDDEDDDDDEDGNEHHQNQSIVSSSDKDDDDEDDLDEDDIDGEDADDDNEEED